MTPPGSEHLKYSPITRADIKFCIKYLSHPKHTRYLPNKAPYPDGPAIEWAAKRILHWEKHGFGCYILQDRVTHEKIGFCGLEYLPDTTFIDIRYGLVQKAWGKSLAIEAAHSCILSGFEHLNPDRIYGAAMPENRSSVNILKKLGMTPDPDIDVYKDGVKPFSIHRQTWQKCQF